MANVDELCGKMVLLKTLFDEMYQSGGLISVQGGDNGIHVTTEFLHQIPGELQKRRRKNCKAYPWEISKTYYGTRFYSIEEEAENK
ncbi:MAG: hypothetical protein PHF61_11525 [Bacteroidales bacterium]|nr:hypothetical protein [Bacteroidales bacterium]